MSIDLFKLQAFGIGQDVIYQSSSYGEFQNRGETIYIAMFGLSESQYSNARIQINTFTTENVFKIQNFFIENLTGKLKVLVKVDKRRWV